MLFCASLFPYATSIVSANYYSQTAQVFYGIVVLAITLANANMYASIAKADGMSFGQWVRQQRRRWPFVDLIIKIIGLTLTITVYPPAMLYSVLLTLLVLVIPNQIKHLHYENK